MELRQLLYTVKIAEEKNFSRAAEKLHIAQPSLSQQLSKLEKEIGVRLFDRNTNSVQLTYAGSLFVEKSKKVMDMMEQIQQEMDDISQLRKGKLVIGSLPISGSHILPLILPVFKRFYPDIETNLIEETSSRLELLTASGEIDVCILTLPIQEPSLEFIPIIEEELILAVPENHLILKKVKKSTQQISLRECADEPFIVLKKGQGFRQISMNLCEAAGFQPKVIFESSNIETVQSLVAAGMGIAIIPKMITRQSDNEFTPKYVTLEGKPTRTLVIAYRKGRYLSKAVEAFMETLSKTVIK